MNDVDRKALEQARLTLARLDAASSGSFDGALPRVTALSAQTLRVERVSVWMFEAAGAVLRCRALYERSKGRFTAGTVLDAVRVPLYVQALETRRVVAVEDAQNDPATAAFTPHYLKPLGITSMMDAPVFRCGEVVGVVCHEHVGPMRAWTQEERAFAASVADIVALLVEQALRIELQAQLASAEQRLVEAARLEALGHMGGEVAHDFNNILTVVEVAAQVASLPERTPDEVRRGLDDIRSAVREGRAITGALMAFGRGLPLDVRKTDLADLVRAAEPLLASICRDRCTLRLALSETGPVQLDPVLVRRVLLNLASNARDAMPSGGTLTVTTRRDGDYGLLEVTDEGVGMDADTRERAFEPYFTTKGSSGGTGLGLASVYGIVRQNGGFVEVDSAPGSGSTFRVRFPVG